MSFSQDQLAHHKLRMVDTRSFTHEDEKEENIKESPTMFKVIKLESHFQKLSAFSFKEGPINCQCLLKKTIHLYN